jgi:hypothetical protein
MNFDVTLKIDSYSTTRELLRTSLEAAVPLWVLRVRSYTIAERDERLQYCGQMIAEHGDDILFRSKKKGGTAAAFNALAEGIAILSFAPGGVNVFGGHWETIA